MFKDDCLMNERECARENCASQTENLTFNSENCTLGIGRVGIQFHIPIEIITPTVRGVPNPDGNGHNWIPSGLHWLLQESHPGFFRRTTTLFVVTTPASRYDILPSLSPTFGDGNDMIERQLFSSKLVPTILAGVRISRKDINAGELDRPVNIFEPDQLEEPHHGGKFYGN